MRIRIRDGYGSRICVYCKRGRARTWVASMGYAHKRCIEANARAS